MIVLSISAVSADDSQNTDFDVVSGDVDVASVNPFTTSGQLTYDIPSEAKNIKSADLYVNVYSGSAQNTYGANANVSINTGAGDKQIAAEQLWTEDGSTDGTIYYINDHVNKCYSDYQMYYDITDSVKGLNGSSVSIKVDTFKMDEKQFDGRIKLIALVLAYDDGDNDTIAYWVDSTQKWTKTNITTTFASEIAYDIVDADLINIALSSADGSFRLNGELIGDPIVHSSGNYYQYNYWDITSKVKEGSITEFLSINPGTGTYASLKNVLTLLKIQSDVVKADVSLATEYTNTCFAGTNNTITVKAKADKNGSYVVELLADGIVVDSTAIDLYEGTEATVLLTDPSIRPIDETTVNGANNTKVTYTVNVKYADSIVGSAYKTVPVLYNGYLGKDLEYDARYIEDYTIVHVTGGTVIAVKDDSTYLSGGATHRTDVWDIDLFEDCTFDTAFLYIAYNWDKTPGVAGPVLNVTFNGNDIVPKAHYRDQSNLGGASAKYGYGLYVYDVSGLIIEGNNTLVLNKPANLTAVYPSCLIYFYNDTTSKVAATFYIADGADLISNSYNNAGRLVKTDSLIGVYSKNLRSASLFVFAASAQAGEGNIVFNGVEDTDVWHGSSNSYSGYIEYIYSSVKDLNEISFVGTGSTILALQQMIVTYKEIINTEVSFNTEYNYKGANDACYAGANNVITATVKSDKTGSYVVELIADGVVVDTANVDLNEGVNATVLLTDPTIRPINETTVSGADNTNVKYVVALKYLDEIVDSADKTVPVLYNGYFGKNLEYNASYIEDYTIVAVTGGYMIDIQDDSTYLSGGATNRTDVWDISLGEDDSLDAAFLYISYNWDKTPGVAGPVLDVTFNGNTIVPKAHYRDQSNLGTSGKYGYGLYVYDVSGLIKEGNNTLVLNKPSGPAAIYPSCLLYFYNCEGTKVVTTAYIADGADLLSDSYNEAERLIKTDALFDVYSTNLLDADLVVFAASAQAGEGNIVFNGVKDADVWKGSSNSYSYYYKDIYDSISDENEVSFVATGSTILALQQMIVTYKEIIDTEVSFNTEYSNTCFAGTNNTVTVKAKSDKNGSYVVELFADGVVVDTVSVDLSEGIEATVLLTDPTIRPIDETTVNGANNTNVNYVVTLKYLDEIVGSYVKTVPVLYNGYLGKDLAYNATYIEEFSLITVTGGVIFDIQEDSTYMKAGDTNRTDVWSVDLDSKSSFDTALVYIAYNWDKTSGVAGPVLDVTFNGKTIVPKAHYRDQSNLGGASAKYGYGLYVYDVSTLIKNGDNTLVINKPANLTAVYPSTLIYFYNTLDSDRVVNAYIADGADLLYNNYNVAGRLIKTDSQIYADFKDVTDAALFVFAASAQAGEGNIIFNGVEDVNVWNGTSNSYEGYFINITNSLKDTNEVSFVSTGGTIVALQQLILTAQKAPVFLTPNALSTTYDSGKAFTVTVKDINNKPVSGLKLDLMVYTNGKAKTYHATTNAKGVASWSLASKLAIGTHKVVVSSSSTKYVVSKVTSSIKVSKARTIVKAPKVTAKVKKNKYFKVTVKNKATKKVVKNIKVKVKVYTGKKYKTYTIKTNSKGIAKLNTKSLKVGSHKVVITSGNAKYIISAKSTIVIKK